MHRIRFKTTSDENKGLTYACIVVFVLSFSALAYMLSNGQFGKLWGVTWANTPVWFILLIIGGWGLFWTLARKEINWVELLAYWGISIPISIPFIMMGYWLTTGLYAVERINGHVEQGVHLEEYTTEHEYKDDEGKKQTYTIYHPPKWYLISSVVLHGQQAETEITKRQYRQVKVEFGNEKWHDLTHTGQISDGDGDMYTTTWDGSPDSQIPMVTYHPYVDYLQASTRLKSKQALTRGFEDLLVDYPAIENGTYGKIELYRVLTSGVSVPQTWKDTVDSNLDRELMRVGSDGLNMATRQQCNILVCIAGTGDRSYAEALNAHWLQHYKNDIIIIIGSPNYPTIDWVEVLCLATEPLFAVTLRDQLENLGTLSVPPKVFTDMIVDQVQKSPANGGYQRLPMETFEHRKYEVRLPLWASIMLVITCVGIMTPFGIFFFVNDFDDKDTALIKG